jgi:membrane peptidoglycan carboxypeptidase
VYRMSANPYLYRSQPADSRRPLEPFAAFSIGANEMSTLDMAAGIQTIANEGVHIEPYYVEYIDDAQGNRIYTHVDAGTRVLDRDVALTAIDVLKGVNTEGTGARELADFASRVPSFGKTGTQQSNWTAFYVGSTRYLSTAVLVRDPNRYTEMEGIPEFLAAGVDNVQGGTFPARIWRTFMEQVGLEQLGANIDWPAAPPSARPATRLVLPGNECVYQVVGFEPAPTTPPSAPPAGDAGDGVTENLTPPQPDPIQGFAAAAPPTTAPPAPDSTTTTAPPVPIYAPVPSGTTIPPTVLDPNAPLPSVPLDRVVRPC